MVSILGTLCSSIQVEPNTSQIPEDYPQWECQTSLYASNKNWITLAVPVALGRAESQTAVCLATCGNYVLPDRRALRFCLGGKFVQGLSQAWFSRPPAPQGTSRCNLLLRLIVWEVLSFLWIWQCISLTIKSKCVMISWSQVGKSTKMQFTAQTPQ